MAGDVGEAVVTAVVAVGELFVIEPEHVEDGGVEVVDVDLTFGDADAAVVGGAVDGATFDAGAGHQGRKRPVMMVSACLIGGEPYTSPVGSFAANGYGLHDMDGNVYEWCWDLYGSSYFGGTDPKGSASGAYRVARGGSWFNDASFGRVANRSWDFPLSWDYDGGFRLARGL